MRNVNVPGARQSRNLGPMASNPNGVQNRSGMSKMPSMAMHEMARAKYFADMKRGDNVQTAVKVMGGVKAAAQFAQKINNALPPEHKITNSKVQGVIQDAVMGAFKTGPKPSGDILLPTKGKPTEMNSSYGLSKAPNPKQVSLNSGIAPNTFANDYMTSVTNLCAPLHMSSVSLQIPTSASLNLYNYFINTIAFDIQTRAQSNISFDLNIATQFTGTNLLTAFNATINALQIYYYYASILSYESDPRNKNEGMSNLRSNISSQMISDLAQLGRRLEDTPCPPRIVEWVRYMSMNYLSGNSQGSPLLKIGFNPEAVDVFPATTRIATALTALNSQANITVFSLLRRSVPQWRIGTLYDVPAIPVYDKNFLTIFANLPSQAYNAGNINSRVVADSNVVVSYNSFNNRLDGVAYAMGGVYDTSLGQFVPGLAVPGTGATAFSLRSWYNNGSGGAWVSVVGNAYLVATRQESYSRATVASSEVTPHLFGAEKAQNVTGNSMSQTARNVLDFLFNVDSIPVRGKLANFNHFGNGNKI